MNIILGLVAIVSTLAYLSQDSIAHYTGLISGISLGILIYNNIKNYLHETGN